MHKTGQKFEEEPQPLQHDGTQDEKVQPRAKAGGDEHEEANAARPRSPVPA